MELEKIIKNQMAWSLKTFGPGQRDAGLIDHIKKELVEIEKAPGDLEEWIDVIILALDAAWRNGYSAECIVDVLITKQQKNEKRNWPDWRTAEPGKAIEHVRGSKSWPCAGCGKIVTGPDWWSKTTLCKQCRDQSAKEI